MNRKAISAFIRKEFFHIFRDRRTMLILLGTPVLQVILFGFALSTEVKDIRVAVVTPVHDEATRRITERIHANEHFIVTARMDSPAAIDRMFLNGTVDLAVVFSPHFAGRLYTAEGSQIRLIPDATDTNTATAVVMYATNIIRDCLSEPFPAAASPGVKPHIRMLYNPQMKSSFNFVPGVMGLILMLICAMMTSISIVREKETGTMEVLLVSPVKPVYIILSKMIPYLTLSCVNFATILLLAVLLLDIPLAGNLGWIIALSMLFIPVSLAIGLLVSTVTQTQMAAMLVSAVVLILPVVMLSGMIFPVENMPGVLQAISLVIPARWYIDAMKKLMIQGVPAMYVAKEFAILFAMAAALIAASLKNFKNRLDRC
jgi:ABC-2 type transport system permease protein